jgi:hypothetical protein
MNSARLLLFDSGKAAKIQYRYVGGGGGSVVAHKLSATEIADGEANVSD